MQSFWPKLVEERLWRAGSRSEIHVWVSKSIEPVNSAYCNALGQRLIERKLSCWLKTVLYLGIAIIFISIRLNSIHARPGRQLLILIPQLRDLKESIHTVALQTVYLEATRPILGIDPAHRQANTKSQIGGPTRQ
jgi:hypothetical protein